MGETFVVAIATIFTIVTMPRSRFWKLILGLYACVFCVILVLAYTGQLPAFLTRNDKLGHLVLYAIATFVGHTVLRQRKLKLGNWLLPAFPFGFGLFTLVEECIQSQSPNRNFDGIDLIASFVGIALGYWLVERQQKKD